jgi:hypothetical protein
MGFARFAVVVSVLVLAWPASVVGQATTPAGQAIPRAPDGKPDLSGVWQVLDSAAWDLEDHHAQPFPGLPARFAMPGGQGVVEGGEIPYHPAARARKQENYQKRATADPEAQCFLPGVPRITYQGYPFQIIQTPRRITMLYEFVHAFRNIPIDSTHPEGPLEFWLGDSRGRWDGDTFVVDVVHFTDQTWLDRSGNFHSEELHVVERYAPVSRDVISYEVTIEDPKTFTRPWKISMPLYRRQERNIQLLEFECYAFLREGATP